MACADASAAAGVRGRGARTCFLLPAAALFTLFMLAADRLHGLPQPARRQVEGGCIGRQVEGFVGLDELPRRAHRPRVPRQPRAAGGLRRDRGAGHARAGAAVRAAARLARSSGSRASPGSRSSCPTRVPGVIASLLWGFLYLPGAQPDARRVRSWSGCRRRTSSAAADALRVGGQHRDLGRRRLQHDRALHGAARDAAASSTTRPASTAPARSRSRCGSRCR